MLVGTFTKYRWSRSSATIGIVLAALYMLWLYQRTMHGPVARRSKASRTSASRGLASSAR